jgi:hypothetical protein
MFSGMMRRPAGFVQQALRKTFGGNHKIRTAAVLPDYWPLRFSNAVLCVATSVTGALGRGPAVQTVGPAFSRHLLIKQQGRAASFLVPKLASGKPAAARP